MQLYKTKHDFIHNILHKSRVVVGRGGFEPKRTKRNPFKIKACSDCSPNVPQEKMVS